MVPAPVMESAIPTEAISIFEERHNVKVHFVPTGWDMSQLTVAMAAGNPPDVFYGLFLDGRALPLDPYLERLADRDQYLDWWFVWEGKTIAAPLSADYRGVLMNTRLFAEAGLPPTPPESWEEMYEAARRLTRVQNDVVVQGGWEMKYEHQGFEHLVYQNGGDILDPTWREVRANSPQGLEALEFMKSVHEFWTLGEPLPIHSFGNGNVAMVDVGPFEAAMYVRQNPEIEADMRVFAPRRAPDRDPVAFGYQWFLSIPWNVPDPDLAWELLAFLTSREAIEIKLRSGSEGTLFPRYDIVALSPELQPFLKHWYDISQYVRFAPLLVNQGLGHQAVWSVLRNEVSAAAALENFASLHQAWLDEWWTRYEETVGNR